MSLRPTSGAAEDPDPGAASCSRASWTSSATEAPRIASH